MNQPLPSKSDSGRALGAGEYWYEDLAPGDHYATAGVTVTEAHVVGFAGLVGDLFDVHMDEEFARAQGFPGRIAHGLLGLSMADGLKTRCPVRLMGVATLGWSWSFRAPILIGDRICARISVRAARLTKRGDRGILSLEMQVLNQSGRVVQEGTTELMVRRRGSPESTPAS
ncbi:MAG: MaoC family dehydratase N-terminal domain-containing protein [Rhodospirillales bacterium]|nr:MaoC family dehydratase N-terminal domain-containing protein [Rhodospirillales bacterium]